MGVGDIVGISFLVVIIVLGLFFGVWVFYKRNRQPAQIHNINAYDNPIYDGDTDMENAHPNESLYSDVPENNENVFNEDGYMDVCPPSPTGVSTFYNTGIESPEVIDSNNETDL